MGIMDSIVFETTSMGLVTVENDTVNYIFFNLQSSTSPVKEIYEVQNIGVIPNPANESVKINYPTKDEKEQLLLKVIDLNGKILKSILLDDTGKYLLNTSDLDEGIFILHISDGKEILYQNKLILIH